MSYISDYHMHSHHSFDAVQTIEQAAKKAVFEGLDEICFTEHVSMDPEDKSYSTFEFEDYKNEIERVREDFKGRLNIKIGIEAGEPHLYAQDFNTYYNEHELDFIIGSVHNLKRKGLNTNLRENGVEATYKNYFEDVLNLAANGDFDVAGHLDLVQRYAYKFNGVYKFNEYKDIIYDILKTLIQNGKGIEINTSGYSTGLLFPKLEILQMYKDLKGEIITVGSDAHNFDRVGEHVARMYALLGDLGFKYVFTFDKRRPEGHIIK